MKFKLNQFKLDQDITINIGSDYYAYKVIDVDKDNNIIKLQSYNSYLPGLSEGINIPHLINTYVYLKVKYGCLYECSQKDIKYNIWRKLNTKHYQILFNVLDNTLDASF